MAKVAITRMARDKRARLALLRTQPRHRPQVPLCKLYIADRHGRSQAAVTRIKEICARGLGNRCRVRIIDLVKEPALARRHNIVVIPTLVCELGAGRVRQLLGDLSDTGTVLAALSLAAP